MIRGYRQKTKTAKARNVRPVGLTVLQRIEDFYTATEKRKEKANPKDTSNYFSQYSEKLITTFYIAELLAKVLNQEDTLMRGLPLGVKLFWRFK